MLRLGLLTTVLDRLGRLKKTDESTGLTEPSWERAGGSMMGEGTREGLVEWRLRVRKGPRKGLAEGVKETSDAVAGGAGGGGGGGGRCRESESELRGEGESSMGGYEEWSGREAVAGVEGLSIEVIWPTVLLKRMALLAGSPKKEPSGGALWRERGGW